MKHVLSLRRLGRKCGKHGVRIAEEHGGSVTFSHLPGIHHQHPVRVQDGINSMRNGHRRGVSEAFANRRLNGLVSDIVYRGCAFVHEKDFRTAEDGPGQRDLLSLALTHVLAALCDEMLQLSLQTCNKFQ